MPAGLDDLVALLSYEGPGRELVARLKYRNHRASLDWLAQGVADRICAAHGELVGDRDTVLTWAPTTPERRRARGFDQAELLARAIGRNLDVATVALLQRRPGPAQTGRSGADRRSGGPSFSGAARVRRPPPTVVVVDDVVTSGTTMSSAALALRAAGVTTVIGAVAARTPPRTT